MSPKPVQGGDAPAIAGEKAGEPVLGNWRQQVIADGTLVLQEFSGHHGTDSVPADVFGPGRAATVAIVTS
jgi:hypothetical protein